MRYSVQGVDPATKEWSQLYASDVKERAESVAAGVGWFEYFEDIRVIDTEEE